MKKSKFVIIGLILIFVCIIISFGSSILYLGQPGYQKLFDHPILFGIIPLICGITGIVIIYKEIKRK